MRFRIGVRSARSQVTSVSMMSAITTFSADGVMRLFSAGLVAIWPCRIHIQG